MIHLGSDIHIHLDNTEVQLEQEDGLDLEGHILFTLSVNYKVLNLW